jgi:HPt (histidine-containing phosphotransfer) domain-containing protein
MNGSDSSSDPPVDLLVITELRQELGGAESPNFQDALTTYFKDATQRLTALVEAVCLREAPRLKHEAHALKGASGYFGARKTQKLCFQIEWLADAGRFEDIRILLAELKLELDRVKMALEGEKIHGTS